MQTECKPSVPVTISLDFTAHFKVSNALSYLLGLRAAEAYCRTLPVSAGLTACVNQIVRDRGLALESITHAAQCVPPTGALLVTANHPTGILDGVVLLCGLLSRRNDVKVVANSLLCSIPVFGNCVIPINKKNTSDAHGFGVLLEIRRAWKRGECVVVFPAGTVAHWQWKSFAIADAPWTTGVQAFATSLNIPQYRAGLAIKNPAWFHVCAAVSRTARVAFLLRAFFSRSKNQPAIPVTFSLLEMPCKESSGH